MPIQTLPHCEHTASTARLRLLPSVPEADSRGPPGRVFPDHQISPWMLVSSLFVSALCEIIPSCETINNRCRRARALTSFGGLL